MPPPIVTSVEPASAPESATLQVTIRGERFFRTAQRRLGSAAGIDATFHASLGGVPLESVRWVSSTELTAHLPGGLPPGIQSLVVDAPNGRATLPDAFLVLPIEHCSRGVDDDGDGLTDCADPDCQSLSCDDGDPCTAGETCNAGGSCVGAPACTPPGECWSAQCDRQAGCLFTVNVGQPCSQGTCQSDGACINLGPWPYPPSNFDPAAVTPGASGLAANCDAVFSTTSDAFTTSCGLQPNVTLATLSDGRQATLLAFRDLTIEGTASLRLIGQKPAIVAVFGEARIHGSVLANSTATFQGAGGKAFPVDGGSCVGLAGGIGGANSIGGPPSDAAGGGGAGYRDPGGAGGDHYYWDGGVGGGSDPAPRPAPLRGGCPGGSPAFFQVGAPGTGGGALQLSASGGLLVSGWLTVSGGGGSGGDSNWAGG
ncbi:MAG TPA: IPT/TIG domain-containing protein, partial [Myxococcaceae bacterium]|nr:IPT/TIG domain-containing protein [Myxococcaceae bacterium]